MLSGRARSWRHVVQSEGTNRQVTTMSLLQYRYGFSGVAAHQPRICVADLRARVLSLSELPAPQPSTRGDAANTQSWGRLPSELLPAARSHAESCKTIEPKRRDEPQRGLAYNRGPS